MLDKMRETNTQRLEDIKRKLPELDRDAAVEALLAHIDALEDELTSVYQYYEEFLLPQLEGTGWAARAPKTNGNGHQK
jgi:hypothetical protein